MYVLSKHSGQENMSPSAHSRFTWEWDQGQGSLGRGSIISCTPAKVHPEDCHVPCAKAPASPHPSTLFLLVVSGQVP